MMRSEYSLRSEYVANLDLQASRVLTRHACQRVYVAPSRKPLGFAPMVTLSLASIIGVLLSFGV